MIAAGIAVDASKLLPVWNETVGDVLAEATLKRPADGWMISGGRQGTHTEHLGHMLAQMQFLKRAYPGAIMVSTAAATSARPDADALARAQRRARNAWPIPSCRFSPSATWASCATCAWPDDAIEVVDHAHLFRLPGHGRHRRSTSPRRWPRPGSTMCASTACCRRPGPRTGCLAAARDKLRANGIAPPERAQGKRALFAEAQVACPTCGSKSTERVSEFGSTACKAHYRCLACREPFQYFKCI